MNPFNDDDMSDTGDTHKQVMATPNIGSFTSPIHKTIVSGAPVQSRSYRRINLASIATTPVIGHFDGAFNDNATPVAKMRRIEPSSPFLGKRSDHSPISPRLWKKIGVKQSRPRYDDTPIIGGGTKNDNKDKDCILDLRDLETIPLHTTHLFRVPSLGFECNNEVTFSFTNNKSDKKKRAAEDKETGPKLAVTAENKPIVSSSDKLGCNCRNSKCLKLYCECLRRGDFCDPSCNCHECENHHYSKIREGKIKDIEKKNPMAFKSLMAMKEVTDIKAHHKGCNCKKSNCLKNYCECHQFGLRCTPSCKCLSCKNTIDDITEQEGITKNANAKIGIKVVEKVA